MSNDEKLTRMEDKIDRIGERLSSIDSTLVAQHISLKDHIRRTEILEEGIEPLKKRDAAISAILKIILFTVSLLEIISFLRK